MSFDTVVFGSYEVGTGFTPQNSISEGGFRVFIVPSVNIGDTPLDVGLTYVDQFGNTETTDVTTSVAAGTTSGTHIEVSLNAGDTGIRSISSVSITGGTAGETFNLESWNEGLGSTINLAPRCDKVNNEQDLINNDYQAVWITEDESTDDLTFQWNCTQDSLVYDDANEKYTLDTESLTLDLVNDFSSDNGFLECTRLQSESALSIDLHDDTMYEAVDDDYQNHKFVYNANGFFEVSFDYDIQLESDYFVFELLDADGNVVWSDTGTATSSVTKSLVSTGIQFRLRCKADYTSPPPDEFGDQVWFNWVEISNVSVTRYKLSGYIHQLEWKYRSLMKQLAYIGIYGSADDPGTGIKAWIDLSDDGPATNTTGWTGPDGTDSTYYDLGWNSINTQGRNGKYWREKIWLFSDGRYTPEFDMIKFYVYIYQISRLINHPSTEVPGVNVPVVFNPLYSLWDNSSEVVDNDAIPANQHEYAGDIILHDIFTRGEDDQNLQCINLSYRRPIYRNKEKHDFTTNCTLENIDHDGNGNFTLKTENVEPDYSTDIESDSGFLSCTHNIDSVNKNLTIDLLEGTEYEAIDEEYQRFSFIGDMGLYKITFDWSVVLESSYFVLELVDDQGNVKWSKTGTANGINEQVDMVSSSFEFRLRCKADYTSPDPEIGSWDNGITVSNISIDRYAPIGSITQNEYDHITTMDELGQINVGWIPDSDASNVEVYLDLSDDMENFTGWIGPDGTNGTYYNQTWQDIDSNGMTGKYSREKIVLSSDGSHTPTFSSIAMYYYLKHIEREIEFVKTWSESAVGVVMSGYVKNQHDNIIYNALKVILESTYTFGKDTMGSVNGDTGFYQVFVKDAKYDKRHLIIVQDDSVVNLSETEYGEPDLVDGTASTIENRDLHFWDEKPGETVAHKDSLVTY